MPEVRLDVVFNASEALAQLDMIEEKLQKLRGGSSSGTRRDFLSATSLYMFSNLLDRFASRIDRIFKDAISAFENVAIGLQKTRIVAGATPTEYSKLTNDLRDLAREVMIPMSDLSEIAYAFATRGYANIQTMPDVLRPLAIASLITGETLDTMSRSILSLMQAWNPLNLQSLTNLAPILVKQFSDMISYAFAKSPLEVRWFKDIANYAAPLFAQLGYSPQETLSFFMAMAQQIPTPGIGARSARMLLFNISDIERSFKIFEKYGLDASKVFREVRERGGDLSDAFLALFNEISKLPQELRTTIFKQLGGGVRGGMAAMMLGAGELLENIKGYIQKLRLQSIGYTTIAEIQYSATPIGKLQSAQANLSAQLSALGEKLAFAQAALIDFGASLARLASKLPTEVVGGIYGAGKGAQFATQWILPTAANIALLGVASKFFSGSALGGLFGSAIFGSLAAVIGTALYTAVRSYQLKVDTSDIQKFLSAYSGYSVVDIASSLLHSNATPYYIREPILNARGNLSLGDQIVSLFRKGLGFKPVEYIVQTPSGAQRLPAEAYDKIIKSLGNSGTVLQYAAERLSISLENQGFKQQANTIRSVYKESFAGIVEQFRNLGISANLFGSKALFSNFMAQINAASATDKTFGVLNNIYLAVKNSTLGSKLDEQGINNVVMQVIAAAQIAAETGNRDILSQTLKLFGLENIESLIDLNAVELFLNKIGVDVGEINSKIKPSSESVRNEPSYAQLLDLWVRGYLSEPTLKETLPPLKSGDYGITRSWTPYNYSDSVAVGLKLLTPTNTITSANFDAALKPQLVFQ